MNLRAHLLLSLAILTVTTVPFGCKQTDYASKDSKPKPTTIGQTLSCEDEKQNTISLKNPLTNEISFQKSCTSEASSTRTPADIVFVIDVTGSMEDSLNAVKNGVESFALGLRRDKGWDARFAAIGYRDNIVAQVDFTDEKSLASQLSSWKASGGDDAQEAGQLGLATALEMLNRDLQNSPSRASASKNILFIGDAIAYALNNDHFDFSTTELEKRFSSLPPELKLKFYHSAAKEVVQCLRPSLFGCAELGKSSRFAAYEQIFALARRLQLPGKGFDFPFTEDILLKEFMEEFIPERACTLKSATLKDESGRQVGSADTVGRYKLPQKLTAGSLIVEVERCCGDVKPLSAMALTLEPSENVNNTPVASAADKCVARKSSFNLKLK